MNKNILFKKKKKKKYNDLFTRQKHISDLKNKVNFKRKKKINFFF